MSIQSIITGMKGYSASKIKSMNGPDGLIWSSTIMKGSTVVCEAVDQGFGGGVDITPRDRAAFEQYKKDAAEHSDFEPEGTFAGYITDCQENIKRLKKATKDKILVQFEEDGDDEYRTVKLPPSADNLEKVRQHYGVKLKCIVNEELAKAGL